MSSANRVQLSEKHNEKSVRDSVEWNVPFSAFKPEPSGATAVVGVGSVPSSMSSPPVESNGSASEERPCRSWYRFRSRYRLDA